MRSHPEAVEEYSRIKTEGATKFPYDIDGYIAYKSGFMEQIYERIGVNINE
ncbi:MAG: GrpB family protein [Lachnospiraceae bacterium]|nr:GrpB family protein [Lachnospiraceae bacterium]MDD7626915.1 GrpB family protein [Lachnospiraceae bacterium]MDY4118634.1 GrpB family protein [Lachnospiraceae bacterium]